MKLLPTLDITDAGVVNLDDEARRWFVDNPNALKDALLDPVAMQGVVDAMHHRLGVSWSYGSYLEDRSVMLAGSYLDETGGYIHLGIDVNVPAGTPISAPYSGQIVHVFDDGDESCGWGYRLIIKPDDDSIPYLILGHLSNSVVKLGDTVSTGDALAQVGSPPFNGRWFPHLHVQQLSRQYIASHEQEDFASLDGYGHRDVIEELRAEYPDPTWLLEG